MSFLVSHFFELQHIDVFQSVVVIIGVRIIPVSVRCKRRSENIIWCWMYYI